MNSNLHSSDRYLPKSYIKGAFLGSGGFAEVFEFTNTDTNLLYAGKLIPKKSLLKSRSRQKLLSEIKIHKSLSHPHIVNYFSSFEDQENIYLILELCSNQSLSELLKRRKRLTEKETQYYTYQLLLALKYLHSLKILHRDIKLGNLFLTENMEIKLGDFGLATKLEYEGERKRTICGTPNYIAPEVLEGSHCYEADIWSIGVMIYTLLVGYPPFQTSSLQSTYKRIKASLYAFPKNLALSAQAKDVISQILVCDPCKRITIDQLFAHEFFTGNEMPIHVPVSSLAVPPSEDNFRIPERRKEGKAEDLSDLSTSSSEDGRDGVWVERWIRSGDTLGYLLNNNLVGAVFENGVRIVGSCEEFVCIDKKIVRGTFEKYPEELKVYVAFLKYCVQYFRVYCRESITSPIYVKVWKENKHAIFFKLVNKVLQFRFSDKSQVIILKSNQEIIYLNKLEEKSQYGFSNLNEITNRDLTTRLRYTHSILKSLN